MKADITFPPKTGEGVNPIHIVVVFKPRRASIQWIGYRESQQQQQQQQPSIHHAEQPNVYYQLFRHPAEWTMLGLDSWIQSTRVLWSPPWLWPGMSELHFTTTNSVFCSCFVRNYDDEIIIAAHLFPTPLALFPYFYDLWRVLLAGYPTHPDCQGVALKISHKLKFA